jgi:asparagine synthase (glutamine-hydrolysing)
MFMRNQLLRNADWSSMAHSLELRVPLVDVSLRAAMAAHNFEPARSGSKADVVRKVAPELPDTVFSRPKSGFNIPTMQLLRHQQGERTKGLNSRKLAGIILKEFDIVSS